MIDCGIQHGKVETEYNIPQLIMKALKMNGGHKIEDWRGRRMTSDLSLHPKTTILLGADGIFIRRPAEEQKPL